MKIQTILLLTTTMFSINALGQTNDNKFIELKKKYDLYPDSTAHFNKIAMEKANIGDSVYQRFHLFNKNGEYLLDENGMQKFGETITIKSKKTCTYF